LRKWNEATQAYLEAIRITPEYAGAIYNLGVAYLELGKKDLASQYAERLRGIDKVGLRGRLANQIGGIDPSNPRATLARPPDSAPAQTTPSATTSSPAISVNSPQTSATVSIAPEKSSSETLTSIASQKVQEPGCPSPFYMPSDVTQMANIQGDVPTFFTDDALKNNAEGRVVLQAVLCGTGRVSNVTVEKALPYGLTERAIEIFKLINFTPAQLGGKPVSVLFKQEFVCEQSTCRALR
jgi:tetratricopeptide (TPR) repeat protein